MIDNEDIDDSMAANPEEPRTDLGYEVTTLPRTRRPRGESVGRWAVVWIEGATPKPEETTMAEKRCQRCGVETRALFSYGDDARRRICARCQGDKNAGMW